VAQKKAIFRPAEGTHVVLTSAKGFPRPEKEFTVGQDLWLKNPGAAWLVKVSEADLAVLAKMEMSPHRLGDLCSINQGLRTGDNEKYLSTKQASSKWKPAAGGKHVGRYEPVARDLYVYYEPSALDAPRRRQIFESGEKLIVQEVRNITLPRRIVATFDDQRFYCLQSTNVINLVEEQRARWNMKFLLAILNSAAVNVFFRQRFSGNNHIASNQLAKIPVPEPRADIEKKLVSLVEQMLELHKRLHDAKTSAADRELYQRQIDATDREIDRLVYDLYGLTADEIAIVEG
jgi:hypothetical protein